MFYDIQAGTANSAVGAIGHGKTQRHVCAVVISGGRECPAAIGIVGDAAILGGDRHCGDCERVTVGIAGVGEKVCTGEGFRRVLIGAPEFDATRGRGAVDCVFTRGTASLHRRK